MISRCQFGLLIRCQTLSHVDCNPLLGPFWQCVRWKRKPIWFPIAKSKMFRIPERRVLPADEREEITRLYNIYRTEMKSVGAFLRAEYEKSQKELPERDSKIDDEDFNQAMKLNEKWNKEVAIIRERRLAKQADEERNQILEHMISADRESAEQAQLIDSIVTEEKEKAKLVITPEKLDEAIEYALANPVDYNFALDVDGNIVYGMKAKPDAVLKANEQLKVTSHT